MPLQTLATQLAGQLPVSLCHGMATVEQGEERQSQLGYEFVIERALEWYEEVRC